MSRRFLPHAAASFGALVIGSMVFAACGGGQERAQAPLDPSTVTVGEALTPADVSSAHSHLMLRFGADVWLAERCPYSLVYDVDGARLDQSIFADAALLMSSGLDLGRPGPAIAIESEVQLDVAAFDLDGDVTNITDEEAAALTAEVERCPREVFPESLIATALTDRWFVDVVMPLVDSSDARQREDLALDCLRSRNLAWLDGDADRLADVFVSLDAELAGRDGDGFERTARQLDDEASVALAACAGEYYDRLHAELRMARDDFLSGRWDHVSDYASQLRARDLGP